MESLLSVVSYSAIVLSIIAGLAVAFSPPGTQDEVWDPGPWQCNLLDFGRINISTPGSRMDIAKCYKAQIFRARLTRDWNYVVSGSELIDELRRAPEDVLSIREAFADILQSDYVLGDWRPAAGVDLALIPTKLNRKLEKIMPAAVQEIGAAFEDEITSRLNGDEWTAMTVGESIMRVVCRATNRTFVGLPLCQDREYVDLNVRYAIDVFVSATMVRNVPAFLRPIVSRFFIPVRKTYARAERLMSECITERLRGAEEGADDLPDDYLQWVIDAFAPGLRNVPAVAAQILRLNLAAIHSTAVIFTFALYQLAADPDRYQEPIRREVCAELAEHGWTKTGFEHLFMLDSFLREVQRFHGVGAVSLDRKAMRDFKFSNGMIIKKGQLVTAATRATHHDPAIYADAGTFDGYRFYNPREPELSDRVTSPSVEYLTFGTGRHVCPGRFWAANEMKAMMAYMVTHYDMKMEQEGVVPAETWFGAAVIPDRTARMLIRKRSSPSM
ncbi:cytochrome P450 [Auricularia subglabra TFB-10046 SS5]|nr:cytochrome P450 [Auricularia subglabra TFB-10046 SS5]